ncbi:MAG: hypothetical protein ABFD18_07500 [Syntrophomonas sp.]
MEFDVKFTLRNDSRKYSETNLEAWGSEICKGIQYFNEKESRHTDGAVMVLKEIKEKSFNVHLSINDQFGPDTHAFYTRVGSLSRYCKELGMEELLSPHGKLFTLHVESRDRSEIISQPEAGRTEMKTGIIVDYTTMNILIPLRLASIFTIKFYNDTDKGGMPGNSLDNLKT